MKLGIVSVFMPKKEDQALVDLYFQQFADNTINEYTLYCHTQKAKHCFQDQIAEKDNIYIVEIPLIEKTGYQEHSYYLTRLLDIAAKECDYVAIFHPDSFPIKFGWDKTLIGQLTATTAVVAVERLENNDHKPHSCFILMSSDFYRKHQPTLLVDVSDPLYSSYYASCGHLIPDTGSGIGFCLYRNNLTYASLLRTNKQNDHWMLGGIYGDIIFHLGTAARDNKILQRDRQNSDDIKFLRQTIMPKNIASYEHIRERLLANPKEYFDYLQQCQNP